MPIRNHIKIKEKMKYLLLILLHFHVLHANEGSLYFHGNCVACHGENTIISAPSVAEFKEAYLSAFPKKKDFVYYLSTWVHHPNATTTIMHDAVEKYKLMPELGFERSALEEIATYIYETDFSKPHEGHE